MFSEETGPTFACRGICMTMDGLMDIGSIFVLVYLDPIPNSKLKSSSATQSLKGMIFYSPPRPDLNSGYPGVIRGFLI